MTKRREKRKRLTRAGGNQERHQVRSTRGRDSRRLLRLHTLEQANNPSSLVSRRPRPPFRGSVPEHSGLGSKKIGSTRKELTGLGGGSVGRFEGVEFNLVLSCKKRKKFVGISSHPLWASVARSPTKKEGTHRKPIQPNPTPPQRNVEKQIQFPLPLVLNEAPVPQKRAKKTTHDARTEPTHHAIKRDVQARKQAVCEVPRTSRVDGHAHRISRRRRRHGRLGARSGVDELGRGGGGGGRGGGRGLGVGGRGVLVCHCLVFL